MPTRYHPTFVSHAHADNALCDRYVAALRVRGIDAWYDRTNMQDGHFLSDQISDELERRPAFVALLTPASVDSFWVKLETRTALNLLAQDPARLLLPVRIADCTVPVLLQTLKYIDAVSLGFDAALDALAAALALPTAATIPAPSPSPVPSLPALPAQPGPAPAPAGATPAPHLTPMSLYTLGFRGYTIGGIECVLPPICPVPGGVFVMGSDKTRDTKASDDEGPQYPIQVGDFSIGQHPVTVAEYACAVRANVVREPLTREHYDWKTTWQIQLSHVNRPVVSVAWEDAFAYARWLASVTAQAWCLPTEAEWEKMARWDARAGQSRIYPWGDMFDKARCNSYETGNKDITPVGRYPKGVSPYGVHDVAGNVWEWTSSLFKPYPYIESDGREDYNTAGNRVPRGGSFLYGALHARSACRVSSRSDGHSINGSGFRLALSPAQTGS